VGRRAGRSLILALLAIVAVVGCGGGASPSGPTTTSGSPAASASPLGEAELAMCDGTVRMGDGVARLEGIRMRRGAGNTLGSALDLVLEGQRLVLDYAPGRLRSQVRTLGFAVTNLTIAVEGLRTADRVEAAAATIRKRTTALGRAIDHFRTVVGCPGATTAPAEAAASVAPGS
jgi:hypothetical protein